MQDPYEENSFSEGFKKMDGPLSNWEDFLGYEDFYL